MQKQTRISKILSIVLAVVLLVTSVQVIPASAEEAVPEVQKKILFSADFENTSSSFVEDGWTLTSAWRYGSSWSPTNWYEYPEYVGKTSYDNRNVLKFSANNYVSQKAIKTLSIADMKQVIVEFDVVSPNSKTVSFGLIDAVPKVVKGRYYDGMQNSLVLWSGAPTEWTRVKVVFTVQNGSVTTAAYEKAAGASDENYDLVSAYQSVSIAQSYIVDELINLSFYSEFEGGSACYFDNVEVYTLIAVEPEQDVVYKQETLFAADFENTSSSFVEDGWTKVTTYKWYSGGMWLFPDEHQKVAYDNKNVMKFNANNRYNDHVRAIKTLSIEGMKELIVEFDVKSPNGRTVYFGLTDYVNPGETAAYYDNIGNVTSMWSGAPETWTRIQVVFTIQSGTVNYEVYAKNADDANAQYEAVNGATGTVPSTYIAENTMNLCLYCSPLDGNEEVYFDNVEVYTLIAVEPEQDVVYKQETLFAADFENTSSSFVEDGWTKVTTYKWYSGGMWLFPDEHQKVAYDNKNVMKFNANNRYNDHVRAIKTLSIEGMKELIVEFDVKSPNGRTVYFGLTDYVNPGETAAYYDNIGNVTSMWSGAPETWTRIQVVFTIQSGTVNYEVYAKNADDANAQYEAVNGATGTVPSTYIVENTMNLCLYCSPLDKNEEVYFDNVEVYTTHAYKNGKCVDCGKYKDNTAALAGHNLILQEGTIGLNFHMDMNSEVADLSKTEMRFTVNGKTQVMSYDEAQTSEGYRVFACEVDAKQMADEIIAVMYNDGVAGSAYTYSVKEYADKVLADSTTYAKEIPLVQAMLNYGTYAQEYFGYNMENPANGGIYLGNTALSTVTADSLVEYCQNTAAGNESVKLTSASLVLDAKTTLRLYLSVAEGVEVEGLKTSKYGSYIEKTDILPQDLARDVTIDVSYGDNQTITITYNCMAYCYNVLKSSTTKDALKNVVSALCLYNRSAVAYVGQ